MKRLFRKNWFFSFKPFLSSVVIYLIGVILYTLWTSYQEKKQIIQRVHNQLMVAASSVKNVLPPDFHDRALNPTAISDSENLLNTILLSKCAMTAGVKYLYTAVVRDHVVYFTSSSATLEEFQKGRLPYYWQKYPESTITFQEAIQQDEPVFEATTDRWGSFESIIIPEQTMSGHRYLVGADLDTAFINAAIIARIPAILAMGFFFLIIVLPVLIAIRVSYKKNTERLQGLIEERIKAENELVDYKNNLETIVKSRTEELEREIKDRVVLEEELKKAKEIAVRESRAKSIFLANMSHEIRTPMNGVIGMVNILKETELNNEQKEYLDIIEISGNNLLSIINDILDFSKIEAGQVELENTPFNLSQQIEEVIKILHPKAEGKGLKLYFSASHHLPELVKGDPLRFKQIVMNLTNNAIKFTKDGSITIEVEPEKQTEDRIKMICKVIDTGIGISEAGKVKLFKEFSQTDATTSRKFGGTGLGLKISKDLAHLMGGEIGVESTEGKGSTFWFTAEFEKMRPHEVAQLKTDQKDVRPKSFAILMVEDNYISQRVAKTSLERDGYNNIDLALNGKIAVQMFREKEYKIVLMDIRMPVMDGLETTEKFREIERNHPERPPTYIVAFTAYAVEGDREKFIGAGMDDYIAKPFQPEELVKIIEKFADKIRLRTQRSLKILLAEDNKINQKVAMKTLETFGHKVDLVENGYEAIEKFKSNDFDLILMDLEMPEMDGLEATRIIRMMERENTLKGMTKKQVKIVALTAHSTTEDREHCLAAGMDDYISKPFRQSEIARALTVDTVK